MSSACTVGWIDGSIRARSRSEARRPPRALDGGGGVVVELPVGPGRALGQALGVHGAAGAPREAPPPRPAGAARRRSPPWTPGTAPPWRPGRGPTRGGRPSSAETLRHSSCRCRRRSRRIPRPAKASRRSRWRADRRSAWCSCWPWTSTRVSPSFSRSASVVLASFRNTRPRPPRTSSRRTTSWPFSSEMPCSWRRVATGLFRGASNTASMVAVSAPARMVSAAGPARREAASGRRSRIDFPAPVSPVSTFRPGAERDGQRLDDGEVPDPELSEHPRAPPS